MKDFWRWNFNVERFKRLMRQPNFKCPSNLLFWWSTLSSWYGHWSYNSFRRSGDHSLVITAWWSKWTLCRDPSWCGQNSQTLKQKNKRRQRIVHNSMVPFCWAPSQFKRFLFIEFEHNKDIYIYPKLNILQSSGSTAWSHGSSFIFLFLLFPVVILRFIFVLTSVWTSMYFSLICRSL